MKFIKETAIILLIVGLSCVPFDNTKLVGRWTIYGTNEFVDFFKDGTYDVVLPDGNIGERGNYKLKDSVFSIKNAKAYVCGADYWGRYKLTFYGDDSLAFKLIDDSCTNRKNDIVGYNPGLKRYKGK